VKQGSPGRETLVLVTSDHGESLGEHGEETHGVFIYDATLRVPLVLAGPGVPKGRVAQTVARGIDVAPTLLALAGAPPLRGAEGRSLVPALSGEELEDAPAYVESLFVALNLGWAPLHGWRTARLKLIDAPQPELYALDQDPHEQANLAGARAGDAEALRAALKAELARAPSLASSPAAPDPGAVERLAALGYVGGTPAVPTPGRDPKDGIALINQLERGLAEARANPTLAIAALEAVLRSDPRMPLARRYLAIARMAAGDPQGAVREMEALAREAPLGLDDLLLLADHLRQAGRGDEALATVERALALRPDSNDALVMRGRILLVLGRAAEARETYSRALQRSAGDAEALRGAGESALQLNDAAAAEEAFTRILASDPEDSTALLRLGTLRVRAGRLDEARDFFLQVLAREPGNPEALLDLGGLLARSGRVREALPYLERAVQSGARSSVALNSLGFARLETGDARGALAALRESLAQDPRQPDIQQAVARLSTGAAR
jgi:choline-sulfatase